jgi:hypothetical protein
MNGPGELFSYSPRAQDIMLSDFVREIPFPDDIIRAAVVGAARKTKPNSIISGFFTTFIAENCQSFIKDVERLCPQVQRGIARIEDYMPINVWDGHDALGRERTPVAATSRPRRFSVIFR